MKAPGLKLKGRNARVRAYRVAQWDRDPLADVAAAYRSSVAVDKALAEAVAAAHRAGRSWPEIATALGLSAELAGGPQIAAELAARRQQLLKVWALPGDR